MSHPLCSLGWLNRFSRKKRTSRFAHEIHRSRDDDRLQARALTRQVESLADRNGRKGGRSGDLGRSQQVSHACCARAVNGREDHLVEQRKEYLRQLCNRLVSQTTEHKRAKTHAAERIAQARAKRPCTRGIVRHIENPISPAAGQSLKTRGPTCVANAPRNGLRRDREAVANGEFHSRRNRQRNIAMLVRAAQR